MILACPACSTRFTVDSNAFGPGGRRVRCSACRHVWHQPATQAEDEEPLPALFATESREDTARPAPRAAATAAEPPLRPPVAASRAPAPAPRRTGGVGLAWSLLALMIILAAGGAIIAKDTILATWPQTERIYAAVGLTDAQAGAGLELRKVSWKRETSGEESVLMIEGEVANVSQEVRPIPKIRGAILGSGGREIRHWVFAAPEPKLLPGESVRFRTELRNPPEGAERLTMNFSRES